MSAMQKIKEYFALVPPVEYEDDYMDDADQARGRGRREGAPGRYEDAPIGGGYRPGTYVPPQARPEPMDYPPQPSAFDRDPYERDRFAGEPRSARPVPAVEDFARVQAPARVARPRVNDRAEVKERRGGPEEGGAPAKITTLRPRDYSEARTIGEQFRDGVPVIMDLNDMVGSDAKRLVDFAAGCAFALNGSFEKVATKVFLLSPADIDVSAEDRRRIAETSLNQGR
ncbi:cell division protein SepF [Hoyosella rhizosphaerae]|uniref:Cell division protein SepF n=1 Tax=Hoyosella rhizosphaerae TaxID=1755582 RepID=A0A916XGS8_9ACTN|nr:cell division protein SepF [Hoyosella rhizosphaerae]MBN4927907.1 cell division protein SepF [Hoyosella rhizosphaerae]GGC70909.1 cell division protein SepF [Hoyosella rhizosphaerae]